MESGYHNHWFKSTGFVFNLVIYIGRPYKWKLLMTQLCKDSLNMWNEFRSTFEGISKQPFTTSDKSYKQYIRRERKIIKDELPPSLFKICDEYISNVITRIYLLNAKMLLRQYE